jgi:hypothetical protein
VKVGTSTSLLEQVALPEQVGMLMLLQGPAPLGVTSISPLERVVLVLAGISTVISEMAPLSVVDSPFNAEMLLRRLVQGEISFSRLGLVSPLELVEASISVVGKGVPQV